MTSAVASSSTAWLDRANRVGTLEPVGTLPEYRRRGLARAAIYEGLRRLAREGVTRAFLGTGQDFTFA